MKAANKNVTDLHKYSVTTRIFELCLSLENTHLVFLALNMQWRLYKPLLIGCLDMKQLQCFLNVLEDFLRCETSVKLYLLLE